MPSPSYLFRAATACLVICAVHTAAAAQDASGFYQGKTILLTIGGAAGSDEDIYGRLIAKYLGKHIAGNPALAVADMPGSGGQIAAGYIYSSAAKDGTAIGTLPANVLTAPLWFGLGIVPHDPQKFIYLGSAAGESTACYVGGDSPINTLRDAFTGEVTVGALVDGGPTRDGPVLLDAMLGTKFRVVAKYPGTGEVLTAIDKGEVMGACGLSASSIATRHPDWLRKGVLRGLVQEGVSGSPLATRMGIPLAVNYAASAADAELMELAYAQQAFARPFILPPGTPPARIAILRKAFMDTLADGALLADARTSSLDIVPLSGETVAAQIAKLYATPAQIVDRVRAVLSAAAEQ
jgi:tripartite-type tricarboxylate transporter receptor subunit TctC